MISNVPSNPGHFVISPFDIALMFPHGWAVTTFGETPRGIKTDEFFLDTVDTC